MKGNIAKDYGDLIRDIWKGRSRTIAPLRLRVKIILVKKFLTHFKKSLSENSGRLVNTLRDSMVISNTMLRSFWHSCSTVFTKI
jgi:hypothetical protein